MRHPATKLAAAALIVVAAVLTITLTQSSPTASAAVILEQAAQAMNGLKSFRVRIEMRTPPRDNFATIGLDYDFVTIDFWRQFEAGPVGLWRLESPGRVVVMDGQLSTMLYKFNNYVHEVRDLSPERYWPECLVELDKVTAREAQKASAQPAVFDLRRQAGEDGREKIIVTVEAESMVPETDYLHNKYIRNSDHVKVYQFDAETKLLENLEIYVHDKDRDVLVFRVVEVEYNGDLDPALFALELPDDVVRSISLPILPDNEKYEAMTPKQAATAFFTACANEDWDELVKYLGQTGVEEGFKQYLGGLEIIEIGEPFQSANYVGWFIPYKIRLRTGIVKTHNLALRKDNPANRFELDGGI